VRSARCCEKPGMLSAKIRASSVADHVAHDIVNLDG